MEKGDDMYIQELGGEDTPRGSEPRSRSRFPGHLLTGEERREQEEQPEAALGLSPLTQGTGGA